MASQRTIAALVAIFVLAALAAPAASSKLDKCASKCHKKLSACLHSCIDVKTGAYTAKCAKKCNKKATKCTAKCETKAAKEKDVDPVECPPVRECNCKDGAVATTRFAFGGCRVCACVDAELVKTVPDLHKPAPTTTAPPKCPALKPCTCKAGAKAVYSEKNGCKVSCACKLVDDHSLTTLSPAPTKQPSPKCKPVKECLCKNNAFVQYFYDLNGCKTGCSCRAGKAPATKAPVTKAPATKAPATKTTPPSKCSYRPCMCKPGAMPRVSLDREGCKVCSCVRADLRSNN